MLLPVDEQLLLLPALLLWVACPQSFCHSITHLWPQQSLWAQGEMEGGVDWVSNCTPLLARWAQNR